MQPQGISKTPFDVRRTIKVILKATSVCPNSDPEVSYWKPQGIKLNHRCRKSDLKEPKI